MATNIIDSCKKQDNKCPFKFCILKIKDHQKLQQAFLLHFIEYRNL